VHPVDPTGGATLEYVIRALRYGGAVAASGNTGGEAVHMTVCRSFSAE
jgi:NADPH:quinone reductase-like Zn-dependent oxidoreductase